MTAVLVRMRGIHPLRVEHGSAAVAMGALAIACQQLRCPG